MTHRFGLRVYYEDTDLAGIVFYANYLKFIERARTEWARALGIDQVWMKEGLGLVFAVRSIEAEFLRPARFDDLLVVDTTLTGVTAARLHLAQDVRCEDRLLFSSRVTVVCVKQSGQPARLPPELRRLLKPHLH